MLRCMRWVWSDWFGGSAETARLCSLLVGGEFSSVVVVLVVAVEVVVVVVVPPLFVACEGLVVVVVVVVGGMRLPPPMVLPSRSLAVWVPLWGWMPVGAVFVCLLW